MSKNKINMARKKVGQQISDERHRKGLSITDVCTAALISPTTLWRIEKGVSGVQFDVLLRVLISLEQTELFI